MTKPTGWWTTQPVPCCIVAAVLALMPSTRGPGYDAGENHAFLREKGIDSAIHLNSYRTEKRDKNREIWGRLKGSPS
jgi:hypothetical protein